ncbi:MAG: hypothetical protein JST00_10065 [Deltaproteobacteria bacterium]|nr:hypothetical protein [Deltaproteobacteria bacterium]
MGFAELTRARIRVARRCALVLSVAVAPSFACTLLTDLDSLSEPRGATPAEASTDAPVTPTFDAGGDRDASTPPDAPADAPGGTTITDEFDDCSVWTVTGATIVTQNTGNKNGKACRLCANGALPTMAMVRTFSPAVAGARYDATVYARGTTSTPFAKSYLFTLGSVSGGARGEYRASAIQDVFLDLQVSHVALAGAKSLEVSIGAENVTSGECMVVDALSIVR